SWNRYSYVQGDPINNLDPSGLLICDANNPGCQAFGSLPFAHGIWDGKTPTSGPSPEYLCLMYNLPGCGPAAVQAIITSQNPFSAWDLYNIGMSLATHVEGKAFTNCQALSSYAEAAAWRSSPSQFVSDCRNLDPSVLGTPVVL